MIVVEALSARQGGGQTYLINLLLNIPDELVKRTKIIVVSSVELSERLPKHLPIEIMIPELPTDRLVFRAVWYWIWLPSLLKKMRADVLFCPGGTLSTRNLCGAKSAVTHQNMLPFDAIERGRFPYGFLRAKLWLLGVVQAASFRNADLVIFISEYAMSAISRYVGIMNENSLCIPHGVEERFRIAATASPGRLKKFEYVLYVSILDFYKCQMEVVKAWAKLRELRNTDEKLIFIGPENRKYGRKIRKLIYELGLQEQVIIIGAIPYENLPSYYQNAKLNIFASSCETCPSILLEAMSSGRPLLSSNYLPMPELAGCAGVYFDPYKPEELASLLSNCLDNPGLCAELGVAASQHSLKYQWKQAASDTWHALAKLAERSQA